ncbi:hypothetical protein CCMSSC00406_0009400 [Pleurotus cornucopiae]|uniref:Uncharacterized protein n=1 Tax=Pleurotus cornucopiae TaxID=5321 RepID=A0ACB7IQ01_PLECO|nr:hypothetical protein CCMSSC00406_0009400 [Pleurotus cornucopiae]
MNSTLPLNIRSRPVPTPLIISPIPFAPPYSDNSCKDYSHSEATSASSDRTLTPFILSPFSCQSSASAYSCNSFSSVEDWAEISMLSSRSPYVPQSLPNGSEHLVDASQKPKWDELRIALKRPLNGREAKPAQDTLGTQVIASTSASKAPPTPTSTSPISIIPIPETRAYLRKLRSRSLAALQLEGREADLQPHVPPAKHSHLRSNSESHLLSRQRSQHRKKRVHSDTSALVKVKPPQLSISIPIAIPMFTPSIFLSSPSLSPSPSSSPSSSSNSTSTSGNSQPPTTPSSPLDNLNYPVNDIHIEEDAGPQSRPCRWERRPSETISNHRLRNKTNLALPSYPALPKLPSYIPIEGLDTKQDEKLKVKRSREGVVFTVARLDTRDWRADGVVAPCPSQAHTTNYEAMQWI